MAASVATPRLGSAGLAEARRVLEEAGIDQQVPRPRIGDWWGDLLSRLAEIISSLLDLESGTVRLVLQATAWTLIVAAVAAAAWMVWSWWRRSARRETADDGDVELLDRLAAGVDDLTWERMFERAVERGDTSAALEALWNLLAVRLGVRVALPSVAQHRQRGRSELGDRRWTGARLLELARAAGENVDGSAVAGAVRSLERWTYGGRKVTLEELSELRRRVERATAGAAA